MGLIRDFIDSFRSSYRAAAFGEMRRAVRQARAAEAAEAAETAAAARALQAEPYDRDELEAAATVVDTVSPETYLRFCKRRFGAANPDPTPNPVWAWMVRTRQTPFIARRSLGLDSSFDDALPDWCFDRMGTARVEMPDGRRITVAGEHEDHYDPDFCIYNDVVVQKGDAVEIYGYPRSVFPPTDFHTATLVGPDIYIVGSLGYQDERGGDSTPVYRLDTASYRIEAVATTGASPGWINKHEARLLDDGRTIEVTGGEVRRLHGERESFRDNHETFHLDVTDGTWRQVTDHGAWRQFALTYADDDRTLEDLGWYTGEVLARLGYPCEPYQDPEEDAMDVDDDVVDDDDEDAGRLVDRVHVIVVDGVRVACSDRYGEIRVTVQGELAPGRVAALLEQLKELARSTHRVVTKVEEL